MALTVRGLEPQSVFRLNGADENSATYALGWILEQSPHFLSAILQAAFGEALDASNCVITLQSHGDDRGYTDLEMQAGLNFHAILEAKRWWAAPGTPQLKRYVGRLIAAKAERKRLITVSAANAQMAYRSLPHSLNGVPIVHLSWTDLRYTAQQAKAAASRFEEKLWLTQLIRHLQEFVSMERQTDNKVYVVSLGSDPMVVGKTHTWIDVVEKDGSYFHPVGSGNSWPVQPPNYIGFRYGGKLQSVHHIEAFDIVTNVAKRNANWLETDEDHFVYRLGPPIRPQQAVKTGNIFRNGRVWCAIDTLLSGAFGTISAARDETKRRLAELS